MLAGNMKTKFRSFFFITIQPRDFKTAQLVFSKGNMVCEKCKESYAADQIIPEAFSDEIEEYIAKKKADSSSGKSDIGNGTSSGSGS